MTELFKNILVWMAAVTSQMGYTGIMIMMAIESTVIPLPSEIVLPPAGYLAAQGKMSLIQVILSGTFGSLIGCLFSYWLGIHFGRRFILQYGHYFGLSDERYQKIEDYFHQHGEISVFLGRLVMGLRHFIGIPAGVARMKLLHFILFSTLGAALWSAVLTLLGYFVGHNVELFRIYYQKTIYMLIMLCGISITIYMLWHRWRIKKISKNIKPA